MRSIYQLEAINISFVRVRFACVCTKHVIMSMVDGGLLSENLLIYLVWSQLYLLAKFFFILVSVQLCVTVFILLMIVIIFCYF